MAALGTVTTGRMQVQGEADRRLHMCAAAIKRMFHIQLALAFDSLRDRVVECREKKATCRRLVQRCAAATVCCCSP
jgi:hypothetical protein